MFSKARKADVDSAALGEELAIRKTELKEELGMEDDDGATDKGATSTRKGRTSSARK